MVKSLAPIELATSAAVDDPDVQLYLTALLLERGRSANTLAAYRRDLVRYVAWLAAHATQMTDVDNDVIQHHVRYLQQQGLAAASVRRATIVVRSFHRWRAAEGIDTGTVGRDLAVPKTTDAVPKALSEADISRVLDACVGIDSAGYRDRAMLELLYGTGMRVSELVNLNLSALDLDDGMARVFGKGAKERLVPVAGFALRALVEWLGPAGRPRMEPAKWKKRTDADAVFLNARGGRLTRQGAWLILQEYADRVGLGDVVHPHVFRHSCATHMIEHGADIRTVQELLGHASLTTTQRYTRVTTERLRSVFEASHPRAKLEKR